MTRVRTIDYYTFFCTLQIHIHYFHPLHLPSHLSPPNLSLPNSPVRSTLVSLFPTSPLKNTTKPTTDNYYHHYHHIKRICGSLGNAYTSRHISQDQGPRTFFPPPFMCQLISHTAGQTVEGRVMQFGGFVQIPHLTVDSKNYICPPERGAIIKTNAFWPIIPILCYSCAAQQCSRCSSKVKL